MIRLLLCVTLLVTAGSGCDDPARPLVATREGLVRGTAGRSAAGRGFFAFRGIPYGTAPRFERPRRRAVWSGVRDAAEHGANCWQFDMFANMTLKGDEDCLFANVYTPQLPVTRDGRLGRLPVMVWVHGGGFTAGSGDDDFYGPSYLLDENVVLVTFNYRLGVLGFFSTDSADATGNYGMLDQVLLLEWVRDNIASFGGDPDAVTIFGESAGGVSVSLLVLSPLAKGLFHHAISQSGTSMTGFDVSQEFLPAARKLGKLVNCSGDAAELTSCVKEKSPEGIMEAIRPFVFDDAMFLPRVDADSDSPFLHDYPHILLENGQFSLVPWMNGIAEEEGAFFIPWTLPKKDLVAGLATGNLTSWAKMVGFTSDLRGNVLECGADPDKEAAKIRDFYTKDGAAGPDNLLPIARVQGDRFFVAPLAEEVRLASHHAPVYQYLLDHRGAGRLSGGPLFGFENPGLGPTHTDDVVYLFSNSKVPLAAPDSPEYAMIRFVTELWTSFARTGRPGARQFAMPDWPVFAESSQRYMRLNSEPSLGERLFQERAQFWQTVRLNEAWRHPNRTSCN